ncbi:MAG: SDR family oxidoreductase [Ferruginibacter sp.]
MSDFFKNKVVAITGGSDGIGKSLVDKLLVMGAKVATCSRNQDKLYDLQVKHSGMPIHTIVADVSRLKDCENFIHSTIKTFGGIDILINNAGINIRGVLQDIDIEAVEKVMDINFYGTLYCTKLALNTIIERKGAIVGVSSVAGYRGLPGRCGYSASKFAMTGFLEALRTELIDSGVEVMWVCPGFTKSNIRHIPLISKGKMVEVSTEHEEKMMTSEECAAKIIKAIEKRKRTLVFSFADKRTILLNKLFPSLTDKLVKNFFFKNGGLVR